MAMTENEIIERIKAIHPDATIDVAGEDCSFEVYVVSKTFAGLNTFKRQQPILKLFADELGSGKLHALGIKAKTPEELAGNAGLVQLQVK